MGIAEGKSSAAIHEINHGERGGHHPACSQKRRGGKAVYGCIDGIRKLAHAFFAEQLGEKGQRGLARGLAQDCYGNCEEALGIVQAGDIAQAAGREVAQYPIVGSDQGDAQH